MESGHTHFPPLVVRSLVCVGDFPAFIQYVVNRFAAGLVAVAITVREG